MLALPLQIVESLSAAAPAAARRMSTSGLTVSCLWPQNSSRDFLVFRRAEYSWTAMSCRPLSWLFVRVERYWYSLGRASSVFCVDLENCVWALDIMLARTEDVSKGIGSSGLVE